MKRWFHSKYSLKKKKTNVLHQKYVEFHFCWLEKLGSPAMTRQTWSTTRTTCPSNKRCFSETRDFKWFQQVHFQDCILIVESDCESTIGCAANTGCFTPAATKLDFGWLWFGQFLLLPSAALPWASMTREDLRSTRKMYSYNCVVMIPFDIVLHDPWRSVHKKAKQEKYAIKNTKTCKNIQNGVWSPMVVLIVDSYTHVYSMQKNNVFCFRLSWRCYFCRDATRHASTRG